MIRFIRKLTVVEWLVIVAVTFIFCVFAIGEVRAHFAKRHGVTDAQRDIAAGDFSFRIGGKPRSWTDETATIFHDQYGVNLVHSNGCSPSYADWSYDSAYNDAMATALAQRIAGFSFRDAYDHADVEGRKQKEARLGTP